jgi:hypothetical protein
MNPPTPVDEQGRRLAARARVVGAISVLSVLTEELRFYGWRPWRLSSVVEW